MADALKRAGGIARAKSLSPEKRSHIASLAALARSNALTPARRSAIARKAALSRFAAEGK